MSTEYQDEFPSILSVAQRLQPMGHLDLSRSDLAAAVHSALSLPTSAKPGLIEAFHIVLVLHLLVSSERPENVSSSKGQCTLDAMQQQRDRARRRHNLELLAGELLEDIPGILEREGALDIEDILCAAFPFDSSRSQVISVMSYLSRPGIPPEVLCNPLITISASRLWKYGRTKPSSIPQDASSRIQRLVAVYDSASAPRIQHAVHVALHVAYLILLAHLILKPSKGEVSTGTSGGPLGFREPIIAVLNVTNIVFYFPLSLLSIPHMLVLLSLVCSLPTSPSPNSGLYSLLNFALYLHILFLQLPIPPSPVFLLKPDVSLPLSSLYSIFLTRYFFPVFAFFLPVLLAPMIMLFLSISLDYPLQDLRHDIRARAMLLAASPSYSIGLDLLGLWGLSTLLFILFMAFVHRFSSSSTGGDNRGNWEGYGPRAGTLGRRVLIRAINSYTTPSGSIKFPPPLNLFSLPFSVLPLPQRVNMIIWRVLVGPVAFVVAAFWCWNLL